jgi:uncharacterized protein (TIGR00730 family)
MKRVCVFCASSNGVRPVHLDVARAMGKALLRKRIGLVYGGGRRGLMGALADSVLEGGGEVIGCIPEPMVAREVAHNGVTELRIVHSMHERKATMTDLSDAFIALPGGFGTFEEFCEIVTWAQLGLHRKPCGILNVEGYYDPLLALFDRAVAEGFLSLVNRRLVLEGTNPDQLLELMTGYTPPQIEKWIVRDES